MLDVGVVFVPKLSTPFFLREQVPNEEASSHLVTLPDEGDPLDNLAYKSGGGAKARPASSGPEAAAFQARVRVLFVLRVHDVLSSFDGQIIFPAALVAFGEKQRSKFGVGGHPRVRHEGQTYRVFLPSGTYIS